MDKASNAKLSGGHPFGFQAGDLTLTSSADFDPPDDPVVIGGFMNAALNIGEVYAGIARDLATGSRNAPNFDLALHNCRLTAAVACSSSQGRRQIVC